MVAPGLLDTEHGFKLERLNDDRTRFIHLDPRSGLFAYLPQGRSDTAPRGQFEVMNLALKTLVEQEVAKRQQQTMAVPAVPVRVTTSEPITPATNREQYPVAALS